MVRIPAIVAAVVVLMAAAAQVATAGFPNQYWWARSTRTPPAPTSAFPTSPWKEATATFYGDDSGLGGDYGGACGYSGDNIASLYSTLTAAPSTPLFEDGKGCGRCYQVRCIKSKWCVAGYPSVVVTATNFCPPNSLGGWCDPPKEHLDLAPPSFYKLAARVAGVVPIQYRRVPCQRSGGVRFYLTGNNYWHLLHIMNIGGAGDISAVSVKPADSSFWIDASHNWGVAYQVCTELDKTVALAVRITTGSAPQKIIHVGDAITAYWDFGLTYQGSSNAW